MLLFLIVSTLIISSTAQISLDKNKEESEPEKPIYIDKTNTDSFIRKSDDKIYTNLSHELSSKEFFIIEKDVKYDFENRKIEPKTRFIPKDKKKPFQLRYKFYNDAGFEVIEKGINKGRYRVRGTDFVYIPVFRCELYNATNNKVSERIIKASVDIDKENMNINALVDLTKESYEYLVCYDPLKDMETPVIGYLTQNGAASTEVTNFKNFFQNNSYANFSYISIDKDYFNLRDFEPIVDLWWVGGTSFGTWSSENSLNLTEKGLIAGTGVAIDLGFSNSESSSVGTNGTIQKDDGDFFNTTNGINVGSKQFLSSVGDFRCSDQVASFYGKNANEWMINNSGDMCGVAYEIGTWLRYMYLESRFVFSPIQDSQFDKWNEFSKELIINAMLYVIEPYDTRMTTPTSMTMNDGPMNISISSNPTINCSGSTTPTNKIITYSIDSGNVTTLNFSNNTVLAVGGYRNYSNNGQEDFTSDYNNYTYANSVNGKDGTDCSSDGECFAAGFVNVGTPLVRNISIIMDYDLSDYGSNLNGTMITSLKVNSSICTTGNAPTNGCASDNAEWEDSLTADGFGHGWLNVFIWDWDDNEWDDLQGRGFWVDVGDQVSGPYDDQLYEIIFNMTDQFGESGWINSTGGLKIDLRTWGEIESTSYEVSLYADYIFLDIEYGGIEYENIGNHSEDEVLTWDISGEPVGEVFESFRCRAVHENSTQQYTDYYIIATNTTILGGDANNVPIVEEFSPPNATIYNNDTTQITISGNCSDLDGDNLTMTFYNASSSSGDVISTNQTNESLNVTFLWTGLVNGTDYKWNFSCYDGTDTTWSDLYNFTINQTAAPVAADTCTYSSGNFNVDGADLCKIGNTQVDGYFYCYGTGEVTFTGMINASNYYIDTNCVLTIDSGGGFG